ncbi:uncharacterized protein LOC105214031 [Zeugodacus cucurbitae]|uniref:uncharacterized protein LOC105214031 n=1 Tax=Zeugodacus cucurbitae TaxID=28588 RepID=UPI0023D94140|nr:uncharacterized protein LOC105214031 [Zeugodacus cucurbitae]
MSKPQAKATQPRNVAKTTTATTARAKTTLNNPTKTVSGASKVSTQVKKTIGSTTTVTKRVEDEKLKLKSNTQTRRTEPVSLSKSRTPRDVVKPATNSVIKKTVATNRVANTTKTPNSQLIPPTIKRNAAATTRKAGVSELPMRVKPSRDIADAVKKKPSTAIKPNAVLDTYHSVTVASPPPRRREIIAESSDIPARTIKEGALESTDVDTAAIVVPADEPPKRVRTHSLKDEDIIVLRTDSAKHRIEQKIIGDVSTGSQHETDYLKLDTDEEIQHKPVVREPVAFEVEFDAPLSSKPKTKSREPSVTRHNAETPLKAKLSNATKEPETDNYSDDFETYESDFETGSSSQNGSSGETESDTSPHSVCSEDEDSSKSSVSSTTQEETSKNTDDVPVNDTDCEDETELTQYPVTVIQRDKELERKLDSGNYEMNSRRHPKLAELVTQINDRHFDSMDTTYSVASTDQLDSGISSYANSNNTQAEVDKFGGIVCSYGGYADFNTRPILGKRGIELMNKIQFDTLTFSLFELKPISYEVYMQTYGTLNTTQCSTQTNENRMSTESQTESYEMRTMWTQHPQQYDLQTVQKFATGMHGMMAIQNCCGEAPLDEANLLHSSSADEYDVSLLRLAVLRQTNSKHVVNAQLSSLHKPLDFEKLNAFLLRSSLVISKVLSSSQDTKEEERLTQLSQNQQSFQEISAGYVHLETNLLNALRVVRVFASARHDLIITVHASPPDADVYRSDFSQLLMVWSTSDCTQPFRLLSTWSEVCRVEICYDSADIVVCGLHDGSIAMWDLRETYTFCSKLDGYLTHFPATQSVVPNWTASIEQSDRLKDLGAVVDVRSFRTPQRITALGTYRSIQFAALNDTGILTIWTLVETSAKHYDFATSKAADSQRTRKRNATSMLNSRYEYSSPWARVKLIQSAICDLRDYLERGVRRAQTQFELTKQLFQKEIYSDEILRELHGTQSAQQQRQQLQGLRFTGIDTGCERIYVCTNRNFVLSCSKSLKSERFRKINISESGLLFSTTLQVLTNENFLAVGLSNGSVMIVNCNQQKLETTRSSDAKRLETGSSYNDTHKKEVYTSQTPDIDPITGKSCAIQNIILNERRLLGKADSGYETPYDTRPSTAACIALISNQKRPFELRVYDQQIILSGSALRQDLVQSLQLSSDGWRLFALTNGHVRTYDFYLDRELGTHALVGSGNEQRVMDIAVAKSSQNANNLIVLDEENYVEVHLLKQ